MRVKVNSTCTGCGLCASTVPEVFEMNDANVSVVIADPVPAELEDAVRDAIASCPDGAIEEIK